jgi:hypothetical protein
LECQLFVDHDGVHRFDVGFEVAAAVDMDGGVGDLRCSFLGGRGGGVMASSAMI